jgi:hypothetical protein
MAEYDFITGLTRILESKERQEQTRLQTSLAMMEMAQRRRIQSFEMVTKQLEIGTTANKTLQLEIASDFVNKSGLSTLVGYDPTTPKTEMPDLSGAITDLQKDKFGGFSASDASRIVGAVWSYQQSQSPDEIISLMSDLRSQGEIYSVDSSAKGAKLFKAWDKAVSKGKGHLVAVPEKDLDDLTWQAQESIRIRNNIRKEYQEVSEGDFRIQEDLGFGERIPPEEVKPEVVDDPLSVGIKEDLRSTEKNLLDNIGAIDEEIIEQQKAYNDLQDDISKAKYKLSKNITLSPDDIKVLEKHRTGTDEALQGIIDAKRGRDDQQIELQKIQKALTDLEILGVVTPGQEPVDISEYDPEPTTIAGMAKAIATPFGAAGEVITGMAKADYSLEDIAGMFYPFEEGPSGAVKFPPREKTELRERAAEEMGLSTEQATIEPALKEIEKLYPETFDKKPPITMETAYNAFLKNKWNVDSDEDALRLQAESEEEERALGALQRHGYL